MSNNDSTQKTRETIEITDYDDFERFEWGASHKRIEAGVVGPARGGTVYYIVIRRKSDDKYFKVKYKYDDNTSITDCNEWPLIAEEVFPRQITITVYE